MKNWPLFSLAIGAFGIGMTEFTPMGILPIIANSLEVSIPQAGMLIGAYAIGVMLGAPLMTLALSHLRIKSALIILMGIFTLGNLLSGFAPDYPLLLLARLLTSLSHGAFFGLGSIMAARLVPVGRQASAIAVMFMGLTLANLIGVPAATWLGQEIGWRSTFFVTTLVGLVAMSGLSLALPAGITLEKPNVRREMRILSSPAVISAIMSTVLGSSAMFALYTYISPMLLALTAEATPEFVALMLVVIGVGFTLGNSLGGKFANRSLDGSLMFFLSLVVIIMFLFPLTATTRIGATLTLFFWGLASFAIVAPIQMRVMQAAKEAPALASSINIGAFNCGNALGAAVGGAVLSADLGYALIAPVGGLIAASGLTLVWLTRGVQGENYRMQETESK